MNTLKKGIKYIGLLILGFFVGVFIMGAVNGAKAALNGDKSEAIKNVLIEHCDCESVNQFMYMKGIQYSTEDGITNEKVEYELTNCTYENLASETFRLNELLKKEVHDYEDVDFLKLEFVGAEKHETIIIKNGIIQ